MTTSHLRPIDLERLSAGEAVSGAQHLDTCAECAAEVTRLAAEARAFNEGRPTRILLEHLSAVHRPASWKRWWPLVFVPVAAGLAVITLSHPSPPDDVRLKGSGLSTLINGVTLLTPDTQVSAGDRLTFVVEAAAPGFALVVDVEEGHLPTAFAPFGGTASVAVPAGRTVLTDGVTLDDSVGQEWLVTVWCETPVTLEALQLTAPGRGPPVVYRRGCRSEVMQLTKATR